MDFGKLLTRAWDILWNNAFLILLGVLAVFGGAGSGGSGQSRYVFQGRDMGWQDLPRFDYGGPFQNWDLPALAIGGILLLALAILLISLVFWALGTIARGGMISAVNDLEESTPTNFPTAFQAGWDQGWELLGIGLVPAIPGFILLVFTLGTLVMSDGLDWIRGNGFLQDGWTALSPLLVLACLMVPIGMVLSLLRTFANRACVLEGTGVLTSYQRGIEVLGSNLGPAVLLFLLQIAISIAVGVMMIVPGFLSAICCLLWPLLILVQAAFVTYYSTLWTLAWREFVGGEVVSD